MASMSMTIERVRAFNGMDVLVALDEGLFAAEGLEVTLAPIPIPQTEAGTLTRPRTSQGYLVDRGEARMFQG